MTTPEFSTQRFGYTFIAPSRNKTKKYDVFDREGNFITSFGGIRKDGSPYQQYHDQLGYYENYDHRDPVRRNNYYKRHGADTKFESAKSFSHLYLW
jgi:hypothetical protein